MALFGSKPWVIFDQSRFDLESIQFAEEVKLHFLQGELNAEKIKINSEQQLMQMAKMSELSNQFSIFQFNPNPNSDTSLIDIHDVEPNIIGSETTPDIRVRVELKAFHSPDLPRKQGFNRATIRLDFAQSDYGNRVGDLLSWSTASALKLCEGEADTQPKDLSIDISRSFSRPIELPGGFGEMRFEVVAHEEPPWWRTIFNFAKSNAAQSVISCLGFPGITKNAVNLLDEFFGKLDGIKAKSLFSSLPLNLAFSKYARDEYTCGHHSIKVGCISRGHYLFCRFGDVEAIKKFDPIFLGGYGIMTPRGMVGNIRDNPLNEFTYAVIKISPKDLNFRENL